jgi:general secretion pathway protein D
VGDRISLAVNSSSGPGIKSLGLLVGFDPAVLQVVEVTEGDLLKQSDPAANFTRTVDQESGQIVVDLASQSGVAARSGTVVTVSFEVKSAAAESQISISRIVPAGADGEAIAFLPPAAHKLVLAQ